MGGNDVDGDQNFYSVFLISYVSLLSSLHPPQQDMVGNDDEGDGDLNDYGYYFSGVSFVQPTSPHST